MRFRKRCAKIDRSLRDQFEQFGEQVIAQALSVGMPVAMAAHPSQAQTLVYANTEHAKAWLTEKRDISECRETRVEMLEWAIFVFIAVEVVLQVRSFWVSFS